MTFLLLAGFRSVVVSGLALSLGLGATAARSATATQPSLRPFDEVLSAALARSVEARRAALGRDEARLGREQVELGALPDLSLAATWSRRTPETAGGRDQAYALQLRHELYDFGRTDAKRESAAQQESFKSLGVEAVNEATTWRVARAYAALLAAQRLLVISKENLGASVTKLTKIRDGYHKGLRPQNDVVAAEADQANARLVFERASSEVVLAGRQLELLAGITLAADSGGEQPGSDPAVPPTRTPADWQRLVASWSAPGPSVTEKRLAAELDGLRAAEQAVTANTRPTLGVLLNATHGGSWEETAWSYSGQLELRWDLPWTGQDRVEREILALRRQGVETDRTLDQQERHEREALAMARLATAERLWEAVDAQLRSRRRQFELTKARYEVGKASALELSNGELELGNARLEQARIANAMVAAALDIAEARAIKDVGTIFR